MNKFYVFVLFFLNFYIFGQYKDAALWLELDLEKKVTHQHSVLISQNVRLNNNLSQLYNHYSQLSYCYRFNFLKIVASYRFTEKIKYDKTTSYRHRLLADLIFEKEFKKFKIEFRERIQNTSEDLYDATIRNSTFFLRHKLSLIYDLIYFNIGISSEFFMENAKFFNGYRNFVILDKSFNKYLSSSLYYGIDIDYSNIIPHNLYIFGIGTKYKF